MKKASYIAIVLSCMITINVHAQNVGINNTDPKTALDINGGFSTRTKVAIPSGNAVNIPANASFVIVSGGAATGTISCLYPSPYTDGQRMVIYNTNSGGYDLDFLGTKIPLNQGREFICGTLTGWTLLSGALNTEGWGLKGNAGTDTSINFIGTTDDQPLKFKVNNQPAGLLDANYGNIAMGTYALKTFKGNTNVVGTVAIGANALSNDSLGNGNTAVGYYSMEGTGNAGSLNTAVGSNTLKYVEGFQNSAFGSAALEFLRTGNFNTVLGAYAYANTTSGTGNTAVGVQSMYGGGSFHSISGNYNTAVGMLSLKNNIIGNGAVAIGHQAAYSDTAAEGIVAIGRAALYNNNNKIGNLAIGDSALFNNGIGATGLLQATNNLAIGAKTLKSNTTGYDNIAIGKHSLINNTVGIGNIAMGTDALVNNVGNNYNISIGDSSLFRAGILTIEEPVLVKGVNNNIAIGHNALFHSLRSARNVAVGNNANKWGFHVQGNVSIGDSAMTENYEGSFNVAVGSKSLTHNENASANVAIGYNALYNNVGFSNPASNNVAIGFWAGYNNSFKQNNVFVGSFAGYNNKGSNKLYIESSVDLLKDSTTSLIYGDFAADSLLLNAKTVVRNNAVVKGFTKLGGYGTDVPSIKMKKMVLTNGPSGFTSPFIHGLTQSKILSVTVLINAVTGNDIPPRSTYAGFEYDYYVGTTNIFIKNITGNDASIANRPIKILITYEE